MKSLFIVVLIFVYVMSFNMFELVQLTNKNGAMCLDGSSAAIYTYEPDDISKAPNKLILMFENTDFGWCFKEDLSSSLQNCLKWTTTDYGSSNNYGSGYMSLNGILSGNSPGQFGQWFKVVIKSCDGGSFLGNRQPLQLKKQKLYFRGSKIVEQTINYLNSKGWLLNRETVLLAGVFNGGIAALQWSEVFQKNTKGQVKVLTDSAFFLNQMNFKNNRSTIENQLTAIEKTLLTNIQLPHQKCSTSFPNQQWKCFLIEELVPKTNLSVFISQALYDGTHIKQILGLQCAQLLNSLSQCSKKDKQIIEQYHVKLQYTIKKILSFDQRHGAFSIACVSHDTFGGKYNSESYQVPMNSDNMLYKALQSWINFSKIQLIDEVDWPYNTPCAKKLANLFKKTQ